ncbi:MAG: hypothetical protein GY738_13945, partial [Pseudoalteromonas sp.]|nr:hypothetical protein [Pseudoalteromonas sp.]
MLNYVEVCSGEGSKPTPKNIACLFQGKQGNWIKVAGLLDSGNLVPGSAAMSAELAAKLGTSWEKYCLDVGTAAHGGSLEVIGKIPTIQMAVSPNLVLNLTDVIVVKNLAHPLNLSLQFLKDCRAKVNYVEEIPHLQIEGEKIPIVAQMETREMEPREKENQMEGVTAQLKETEMEEETDLLGENQIPLDKISDFTELRQQYLNYIHSCSPEVKNCKILPAVDHPEWGHI